MTCESFLISTLGSRTLPGGLLINTSSYLAQQIIDGYAGGAPCDVLAPFAQSQIEGDANAFVLDGYVMSNADLSFDFSNPAAVYTLNITTGDGVTADYGTWDIGGDHTTFGGTYQFGFGPTDVVAFSFTSADGLATANISSITSANYSGWIGCLVPACAIAPTALPSSPGAIKSSNFTRIFNPLNLPLRSK